MNDETILRMVEETCKVLSRLDFFVSAKHFMPSYNALLQAARENHPDDRFLGVLPILGLGGEEEINAPQLHILFTQLRVALESLQQAGRRANPAGGSRGETGPAGGRSARSIFGSVDLS